MKETALKECNEVLNTELTSINELEEMLSEKFQKLYEENEEAQVAFNELDEELGGLLGKYFVYTLSADGEMWSVGIGEGYEASKLSEYLTTFKEYYNEDVQTIEDCTSKLEYRVMKDMSNAGCDAFTALSMILEEDLGLEDVFVIVGADSEPRIQWANFDLF